MLSCLWSHGTQHNAAALQRHYMPQLMSYVLSTMGDGVLIIQYDDGDLMSGAVSDVAFLCP